jgi:hypothetical protein
MNNKLDSYQMGTHAAMKDTDMRRRDLPTMAVEVVNIEDDNTFTDLFDTGDEYIRFRDGSVWASKADIDRCGWEIKHCGVAIRYVTG